MPDQTITLGDFLFPKIETIKTGPVYNADGKLNPNNPTRQILSESNLSSFYGSNDQRTRKPMIMTCATWKAQGKALVFRCNPSSIQWKVGQRSEEQKTKSGTILHVWKDKIRGTYFDEPVLTFPFQSGNIMPIQSQTGGVALPRGLNNFYEFLALMDEQKIVSPDKDGSGRDIKDTGGEPNLIEITYNSHVFPQMTLYGMFTPEGVSFNEESEDPNQVSAWSANFTVYRSSPMLGNLNDLRNSFLQSAWPGENVNSEKIEPTAEALAALRSDSWKKDPSDNSKSINVPQHVAFVENNNLRNA